MLHFTLHAGQPNKFERLLVDWDERKISSVRVPSDELVAALPILFDDLYPQLEALPRLYAEPDGSFLWTSPTGPNAWQIDGQLHDSAGNLMTIEFKLSGEPPRSGLQAALDEILTLVAPLEQLLFELVRPGIYVDHCELCKLVPAA